MSDLSRSGYSNRKSPTAMLGALALNGSVVALVIAVPMDPSDSAQAAATAHHLDPDPGPAATGTAAHQRTDEAAAATEPRSAAGSANTPRNTLDALRDGLKVAPFTPPPIPGTGETVEPYIPTVEPVFVKARPDPRFATRLPSRLSALADPRRTGGRRHRARHD